MLMRELSEKSTFSSADSHRNKPSKPLSFIRRRPSRKPSRTEPLVGVEHTYDPSSKPQKSCMKKPPKPLASLTLRLKRGTKRERQTLRFNEVVSVRKVRSSRSLIHNECTSLWWTDEELDHIKRNLQKIADKVDKRGVSRTNGRKYCIRGLERFLGLDDAEDDRDEATESVLREQYRQRHCGYSDPISIAALYSSIAKKCSIRATCRGSKDAAVARSFRKDERNSLDVSITSNGSFNSSIDMAGLLKIIGNDLKLGKNSDDSQLTGRTEEISFSEELTPWNSATIS